MFSIDLFTPITFHNRNDTNFQVTTMQQFLSNQMHWALDPRSEHHSMIRAPIPRNGSGKSTTTTNITVNGKLPL